MKTNKSIVAQHLAGAFGNPIHARIAALDNVLVAHDAMKTAIEGLLECMSWSAVSAEPRCAVLVGVGGSGKTSVCNAIIKKFPSSEIETEAAFVRIVPAFYACVPSPSTIKSLASSLLEGLGDLTPRKGSAITLTARLCKLLKACQTKVILLDEFHHLLAEASAGEPRANKVCNWIKSLVNGTGVMVCLVGMPNCEALVNYDSQMSRRFCHRFRLGELSPGSDAEPGALSSFLIALSKQFVDRLALDSFVDFHDHLQVKRIWAATGGNPAFVAILLKQAAFIALSAGRNQVVVADLAAAFDSGITQSAAKITRNPLAMSASALAAEVSVAKLM